MATKLDLQERLNMRFLTVANKEKQEIYGTCGESADTEILCGEVNDIAGFSASKAEVPLAQFQTGVVIFMEGT